MTLTEKLRTLRAVKGYSQENMGASLNISKTAYAEIERGETDVSFSRLEQIAKVFELTVPEFMNIGENGSYYMNGSHNGFFANNITNDSNAFIAEIQKLKAENEGLRKEVEHLNKIISLLERSHNFKIDTPPSV